MTRDSRTSAYRLAIVDDSPFYRLRFSRIFERSDRFTIVGTAANGEEGIKLIASTHPDVVLLDLVMPGIDGFGVLRWAMSKSPVPIVVCSSRRDRESVFQALDLGAVEFVTKPGSPRDGLRSMDETLIDRLLAAAQARLGVRGESLDVRLDRVLALERDRGRDAAVIAIAASTGGPAAIQRLVSDLPRDLSVPIVVVQHMPSGFTRLFAERLERLSHYGAEEAKDGVELAPRRIYVAPGGMQTRFALWDGRVGLSVTPRAPKELHAPSADIAFASMAEACGRKAVAVVLTGMGDDGSRGVRDVKERGGYVLAESVDSALIYGMPRATMATGCADAELALGEMSRALLALAERL
jgi:two-component system, chemotaxis family, protein-glutamate methylesterase/glutaminase